MHEVMILWKRKKKKKPFSKSHRMRSQWSPPKFHFLIFLPRVLAILPGSLPEGACRPPAISRERETILVPPGCLLSRRMLCYFLKLTMCDSCSLFPETPLSLSQLCRVSLRKATGVRGLEKISKLNIPPRLIDYLSYN